jgi:hypothetical protein
MQVVSKKDLVKELVILMVSLREKMAGSVARTPRFQTLVGF